MSGAVRWLPGGLAGFAGLVFGLIVMLLLGLVAVQAPKLSSAAPPQDWEITLEITNAYMGTLLNEQQGDRPIELKDPKAAFSKDGTVLITGSLAPAGNVVPSPIPLPIPLPIPIPGVGSALAVPVEIVLRPGSKDGKFTVEIVRTQLGPIPIPNGLGRLLESPINGQIVNATQGRPFRIIGVNVNDGFMIVRVRVETK
jgi:hypothetical protein